ncbi:MAG TPA: metalloregulator ArsR/SmtB family transcription factor [Acidimicrobiales bacterium]|nr:metalloregulator ArsR/SmtB family transcription factor [Acidimicrobiales bacterium]
MPMILDEDPTVEPVLTVHPSPPVEIDWALSAARRLGHRALRPPLEALLRGDPQLVAAITSLWGPEEELSYNGYVEISALAHHGGVLFGFDGHVFVDRLEDLAASAPEELALAAETPDDRLRILRRLEILRCSPRRRRQYVEVVRTVWSALLPAWETEGRAALEAEIAARRAILERGPTPVEWAAHECKHPDSVAALIGDLGPGGEVALVPTWYGHGSFIVDLPGLLMLGAKAPPQEADGRARSEGLARRLKAIADPTRLAILAALGHNPMTVTDVAKRFSLSQPTVSNHAKVLREAGFISVRSEGRGRQLVVRRDALDGLGAEIGDLLGGPTEGA